MFTNCPHCAALIATDPATDLPPLRCPRCAAQLREASPAAAPIASAAAAAAPAGLAPPAAAPVAPAAATPAPSDAANTRAIAAAAASASAMRTQDTPAAVTSPTPPVVTDEAPSAPSATPPAEATATTAPAARDDVADAPRPAPPKTSPAPAAQAGAAVTAANARGGRDGKPAPSFLRQRAPIAAAPAARRRWAMPAAIAALLLTLTLQWLLADRAHLAADARWRPLLAGLCDALGCALPPWREPSAFALLGRDVRPHPSVPGALRVTATFRNDARWPQPWPRVLLTLSDVDGRAVGARAFAVEEYLGAAPARPLLETGQTATLRLDVIEPAPQIVAFAFDFR